MPYTMYLPNCKTTTDIEEFIEAYSEKYFQDYPKNNKEKEDGIISITQKGRDMEPADVIALMRWKTGDSKTEYAIVDCYGKHFSLDIGENVVNAISSDVEQNDMDMYRTLLKQNMYGLGTVYLLTLVWAISGMKYPIYDKFAKVAITAIKESKKPYEIHYEYPPDKTRVDDIKDMYEKYQKQLLDVFGEDWKTRREIDQALWVYGHQKL